LLNYKISKHSPTTQDFIALRAAIGWGETDAAMAKTSLANSLFHVIIEQMNDDGSLGELIAMGRVIGDGAMYFYIQDVMVIPQYQGQGFGNILMKEIEAYLTLTAKKGATVGLLAAKGKEAFYCRFGYQKRPSDSLGNGMCKFVC